MTFKWILLILVTYSVSALIVAADTSVAVAVAGNPEGDSEGRPPKFVDETKAKTLRRLPPIPREECRKAVENGVKNRNYRGDYMEVLDYIRSTRFPKDPSAEFPPDEKEEQMVSWLNQLIPSDIWPCLEYLLNNKPEDNSAEEPEYPLGAYFKLDKNYLIAVPEMRKEYYANEMDPSSFKSHLKSLKDVNYMTHEDLAKEHKDLRQKINKRSTLVDDLKSILTEGLKPTVYEMGTEELESKIKETLVDKLKSMLTSKELKELKPTVEEMGRKELERKITEVKSRDSTLRRFTYRARTMLSGAARVDQTSALRANTLTRRPPSSTPTATRPLRSGTSDMAATLPRTKPRVTSATATRSSETGSRTAAKAPSTTNPASKRGAEVSLPSSARSGTPKKTGLTPRQETRSGSATAKRSSATVPPAVAKEMMRKEQAQRVADARKKFSVPPKGKKPLPAKGPTGVASAGSKAPASPSVHPRSAGATTKNGHHAALPTASSYQRGAQPGQPHQRRAQRYSPGSGRKPT